LTEHISDIKQQSKLNRMSQASRSSAWCHSWHH